MHRSRLTRLARVPENRLTARANEAAMAWNVKGTYFETCSCELLCPCLVSMDHGATYDYCRVTLVFNITEGQVDGTDVGGLVVAAIADTPKVMTEGNWKLGMFVDENASDEQMEKLAGVLSGQMGGPMAGLAPLVGEPLGGFELLQPAPRVGSLTVVVVDRGIGHALLRLRVGAVQLVDEAVDGHRPIVAVSDAVRGRASDPQSGRCCGTPRPGAAAPSGTRTDPRTA